MVNSKFLASQTQRWLLVMVFAFVGVSAANVMAQGSYYDNSYRIHTRQSVAPPTRMVATPNQLRSPQNFEVELVDPPNPTPTPTLAFPRTNPSNTGTRVARNTAQQTSPALSRAFFTNEPRVANRTKSRLESVFGKRRQDDIFNEGQSQSQTPPVNPFEKVEAGQQTAPPANPFQQEGSPFNQLPQDPNPINPPMDTNPVSPRQVPPVMPPGGDILVDPDQINRNPPVPGEPVLPRPQDDENDTREPLDLGPPVEPQDSCLLYTSPSPRDATLSRMPSSA